MADDMIQKMVPAVDAFFDQLGDVPKRTKDKVQMAMWALLDELGFDLDEFQRAYERYWRSKHR